MQPQSSGGAQSVIDRDGLRQLIDYLAADGFLVIGPRREDGGIVLTPISCPEDLPEGITAEQEPGRNRLGQEGGHALFAHAAPMQGWKRWLYPPVERLLRARRDGGGFAVETDDDDTQPRKYAFVGVRPCDLAALRILETVLGSRGARDARFAARRSGAVVVVANCTRATGTCFCASMGTGPRARAGFDLALTEIDDENGAARMVVASGSSRGETLLAAMARRPATDEERARADASIDAAGNSQRRRMVPEAAALLQRNLEHRQWHQVSERCLGCANCTLVCPTCFCATVEDTTDLAGNVAERWRKWDSCFTGDFTYIHGGSIRRSGGARYRQWITHKLSSWWQQFETSGCVGCGRCITWCPVGIDITEEVRNLRDSEGGAER